MHVSSSSKTDRQRGGRKGKRPLYSGVLQSSVSSTKEGRLLETDNRPINTQSFYRERVFQNGDPVFYPFGDKTGSLGCIPGPVGCVLPCTYSSKIQTSPSILPWDVGISVPSPPIWHFNCPTSVLKTHENRGLSPAGNRFNAHSILRRLAPSSAQSSKPSLGSRPVLGHSVKPRSCSKSREIRISPFSRLCLRRDEFLIRQKHCQSTTGSNNKRSRSDISFSTEETVLSQSPPISIRGSELSGGLCESWPSPLASTSVVPSDAMEAAQKSADSLHPAPSSVSSSPVLVDGRGINAEGSSPSIPCPISLSNIGCEQRGVGGTPRTSRSPNIRVMETSGISTPYKQSGATGCSTCDLIFSVSSKKSVCVTVHGQHNCSCLHSKTRGHSLSIPVQRDSRSAPVLSISEHYPTSKTSSGQTQCLGGRPISSSSITPSRMVTAHGSSEYNISPSGSANGGSICHEIQSPSPTVCLPSSGSGSMGGRCSNAVLGSSICVCIPPVCSDPCSPTENQNISVPNSTCCSTLATNVVVQQHPRTFVRSAETPSLKGRSLISERKRVAQKPKSLPPTRLAVIREGIRKKHFSSKVASFIAKSRRSSTSIVYNAKWKTFTNWCSEREIDSIHPTIQHIADFLTFLFIEKKLAVSTIKGYRAMLSNTLKFRGIKNIGSDPVISELVRSFGLIRPTSRTLTPKWDLSCVLWSLTKAPYEPLEKASITHLSWKTAFLLTFASAKRRSEIHALSIENGHFRFNDDRSVTLLCQPGFLAKTQLPSIAPKPFSIPSLSKDLDPSDPDCTLCPIRVLKFYLEKVKPYRALRKRLFLPIKGNLDISAATISRWIASAIRLAYSSLTDQDLTFLQIRPHELRALSSSWAFVNHAPLDDILSASTWKKSSTFSTFYLRSLSSVQENLFSLGPLVASQTIINKKTN